jgi:hypothetical protein
MYNSKVIANLKKGGQDMIKKATALLLAISLVLLMTPALPVLAATEGSVDGEFSVGTPPTVDSVSLTQTAMTPQQEYTVTVTVSDADELTDLDSVVLKVWYDSNGGTPIKSEFDSAAANTQTGAILTWNGTDFSIQPSTSTTWSLGTCTAPTLSGETTGDFTFVFTVGKVAYETTGSALWQIGAEATDSTAATGWNFDGQGASMNYYGEISVPTATSNWGTLTGGTGFTDPSAQKPLGVTINFIANGDFAEKVKSSSTWTGASETATLDASGTCDDAGEFALKAATSDSLAAAVLVDTAGATIYNSGTRTTETGRNESSMNLWIKLANTFSADTYQGTISYSVVNR